MGAGDSHPLPPPCRCRRGCRTERRHGLRAGVGVARPFALGGRMDRYELERWLSGPISTLPSPAAVALALGLPVTELADTTLLRTAARVRSLHFILAVLTDAFACDDDVRSWLGTAREELRGATPRAELRRGHTAAVEELAIR